MVPHVCPLLIEQCSSLAYTRCVVKRLRTYICKSLLNYYCWRSHALLLYEHLVFKWYWIYTGFRKHQYIIFLKFLTILRPTIRSKGKCRKLRLSVFFWEALVHWSTKLTGFTFTNFPWSLVSSVFLRGFSTLVYEAYGTYL